MAQLQAQSLYQEIEKSLQSGNFQPIYLFFGEEPYLIKESFNYLKACSLNGIAADFNFESYLCGQVSIMQVRDEIETLPLFAARRVIHLREIQELKDKDWDVLSPILVQPVETTVLILTGSKIDKRKKIFKTLFDQSCYVEFKKPYDSQIPQWIRHICKAHQLTILDDALQLFHRLVGSQLSEIEIEIVKLGLFLGDRKQITLADVAASVSKRKEENIFEFAEVLARGKKKEAFLRLTDLLAQGQNELGVVALTARHFRLLMSLKRGLSQGLAGQKLAQFAQVPFYFLNDYHSQAQAWTEVQLEKALKVIIDTEGALKLSPLSGHIWLENLILKIGSLSGAIQATQQG